MKLTLCSQVTWLALCFPFCLAEEQRGREPENTIVFEGQITKVGFHEDPWYRWVVQVDVSGSLEEFGASTVLVLSNGLFREYGDRGEGLIGKAFRFTTEYNPSPGKQDELVLVLDSASVVTSP